MRRLMRDEHSPDCRSKPEISTGHLQQSMARRASAASRTRCGAKKDSTELGEEPGANSKSPPSAGFFVGVINSPASTDFFTELSETKTMARETLQMTAEQTVLYNKLSSLQKMVCMNILHGMTRPQAYKAAGGKAKDSTIPNIVSVMMKNAHVKAFMDEMYSYDANQSIMSRDEAMQIVSGFARSPGVSKRDRIRSVERLARMQGWDAAQKHDLTGHILTSEVPLTDAQRAVLDKALEEDV